MDLSFSPLAAAYINTVLQAKIDTNSQNIATNATNVTQLRKDVTKADFVISGSATPVQRVNAIIAEIFIGNANPDSEYKITNFSFSLTNMNYRFFIYENGVNIISTEFVTLDEEYWNKPYPLTFLGDTEKYGYVVFNQVTADYAVSSASLILSNAKMMDLSFSPTILDYITRKNTKDIAAIRADHAKVNFTGNANVDLRIKELYLPGLQDDWRIGRLYAYSNRVQLFITNDSTLYSIGLISFYNIGKAIYGKVMTIYSYTSPEIIGYCVLDYYGDADYVIDSKITINANATDISKSPTIKAMLEADEQIVLMGASSFGFNSSDNILKDLLIHESGKRVYNCGFGGCRMAWRTSDGSNNYDAFSDVEVADAMVTGDFSKQLAANTAIGGDYNKWLANLMIIDFSKPTTIMCKYIDNDINNGIPLGELWDYTKSIDEFDKTTFLGAMNYVIARILETYPHIRFVFISEMWRYKTGVGGISVPPYAYENATTGATSKQYYEGQRENAWRLGVSWFDFTMLGGRNNYNFDYLSQDSAHFNYSGWQMFARKLAALYVSEYL